MARKRVTEPQLKSWEEVDACLKAMGDAENQISVITAQMNAAIAEAKKEAGERAPTFGTVGFRQSTKLLLPSDTAEVILKLRVNGMADCINVKETINKDTVKSYPEEEILKIGGYLQRSDSFWYETDKDTLAEAAQ